MLTFLSKELWRNLDYDCLYFCICIHKQFHKLRLKNGYEMKQSKDLFNQYSLTLFVNVVSWLFYLECAIKWENIKLIDSITSPLLLELY